jgi:catechol 2,3-dioxygenase
VNGISPHFKARRLGHVNLYISDYLRSLDFYQRIVGLHAGWTRPKIGGGFLNNGASHHDVGFLPWNSPERRVIVNGPGLNHLAFDVGTERDLVAGYRRARDNGLPFIATADHIISKSLYTTDPNDIQLEIYVDTPIPFTDEDFLALRRATSPWDPLLVESPDPTPYFVAKHTPTKSDTTVFPASRIDGATIVVQDLVSTVSYYTDVLGLQPTVLNRAAGFAVLQGALGGRDLIVFEADDELTPGLHHFSFLALGPAELEAAISLAPAAGLTLVGEINSAHQRAALLRDPDNHLVKIFVDRDPNLLGWAPSLTRTQALPLL